MKRVFCAVLCALLLTGCSPESGGSAPFDPEQTTQALLDSGAFSESLAELDVEIAATMFGFLDWSGSADLFSGSKVYYSTGATAELCAVIVVDDQSDGGDMAAAQEDLESWLSSQKDAEQSYRPAEAEKLEHAILEVRGNTILLVVAADWEKAQAAVPAES